jgi:hypothetical protein
MAKPSMLDQMKSYISPDAPAGKLRDRTKKVNEEVNEATGDSHSGSNYYDDDDAMTKRNNDEIRRRRQGGY